MKIKTFYQKNKSTILIVISVFLIKLFLSLAPSFEIDMTAWLAWSHRLAKLGPGNFYSKSVWTQYTPGFLYYLWIIGKLNLVTPVIVKLPSILADITTALLIKSQIQKTAKKHKVLSGNAVFLLYTLSPGIVFTSSVWGQIDSLLSLFLFLSIYFLVERSKPVLSWLSWGVALLIKPQALLLLPILVAVSVKKTSLNSLIKSILFLSLLILLLSFPFFPRNPLLGLPSLIISMGEDYHFTSLYAYNLWSITTGMWKIDTHYVLTGAILYVISAVLILIRLHRKGFTKKEVFLSSALASLAFFLFPTRVHERYIFPFFPFLLTAAVLSKSKKYFYIFLISSLAFLINIYYPFAYYTKNYLSFPLLKKLTGSLAPLVAVTYLISFPLLLIDKLPKIRIKIKSNYLIFCILTFALATRLFMLWLPDREYFDEVYHAFTARRILHADPKAWEWWNPNPEGFAYEWTHPPLAKLGMVAGMSVLGENALGWRITGALLGVGSVYLIFAIAKELFNEKIALLSALIFSLDGLPLTMSRIGMNDSYMLFFMLLAFFLFLKNKLFASALSLGLAAASKWSILWFLPILVITQISLRKKITIKHIWFIVLPPAIYFLSYLPMFMHEGHTFKTFIEVQKQMWWYHTNLSATHSYTSPWWSWPFLVRPIWLYVDYGKNTIKNIYAMGNPAIYWFGAFSIPLAFYEAFTKKKKELALILFSYFMFFIPWAASPRIMFLYHYLPSLPFLSIIAGYTLQKNKKLTSPILSIIFLLFIYFYPHWTGLSVPKWLDNSYYWFPSWK